MTKPLVLLIHALIILVLIIGFSLEVVGAKDQAIQPEIRVLPVPVSAGAREPNLAVTSGGKIFIAWLEPAGDDEFALKVSKLIDNVWSSSNIVAKGDDWFVNWADSPSLSDAGNDNLAATWSVKNGTDTYAYNLNLSLSNDDGATWSVPVVPHLDGTRTQHGFSSVLPLPDGQLLVVWLDGRVNARIARTPSLASDSLQADSSTTSSEQLLPTDKMTLRSALVDADGNTSPSTLLDERVCTCCSTAAAMTSEGPLISYRDRTPFEIRDISLKQFSNGKWSPSYTLHEDGWQIAGCPVNGASLAALEKNVAATWFTAANDKPQLLVAFSDNAGKDFGVPIRVDDGRPMGRANVLLLDDGSALVSWLEVSSLGEELRVRQILSDGTREDFFTVASSNQGRTMGFPSMVRRADEIVFAWMQPNQSPSVRTAIMKWRN